MTDASPPGWHPDPRGRHEHRYWDGTQWTDHVADAGAVSMDPVAEVTPVAAPMGPSMVNLPAIVQREPEPEPEPEPEIPATTSPAAEAQPTAVQDELEPEPEPAPVAADAVGARSPDFAALLSIVAPGSGHLYLGRANGKAYGLLAATVLAVVLAYFNFLLFIVGVLIWGGAAAYALIDLRGGLSGLRETHLTAQLVGWVLVAGGIALIVGLVLPWYHVNVSVSSTLAHINASQSQNFSGFKILSVIDIVLLVVGLVSIVTGLAALGKGPISSDELPTAMPGIVAGGALLALVLTYFRLLIDPVPDLGSALGRAGSVDVSVGRGPGALLCAAAAIALLIAASSALTGPRSSTERVATA